MRGFCTVLPTACHVAMSAIGSSQPVRERVAPSSLTPPFQAPTA